MHQSHVLSALVISLVLVTPACGSKFVPLGDEDAGNNHDDGWLTAGGTGPFLATGGDAPIGGNGSCVCSDPQPNVEHAICSDGSRPAVTCELGQFINAQGQWVDACAWMVQGCPVQGAGGSPSIGAGGAMPTVGGAMPTLGAGGAMPTVGGAMPTLGAGGAMPTLGAGGSVGCVCSGPVPDAAYSACPNGMLAGVFCEYTASGACAWSVPPCPADAVGGAGPVTGAGGAFNTSGGAGPLIAVGGATQSSVTCEYGGVVYGEGQHFTAADGCNACYCMNTGLVACTQVACEPVGGASTN